MYYLWSGGLVKESIETLCAVAVTTSKAPVTSLYRLNQNSDEALDAPWRPFTVTWFCSRPGTKDQMSWGNHGRDAGLRCSVREAINRPVEAKDAQADAPAMANCDPISLCPRQCPLQGRQHLLAVGSGLL